MRARDDFTLPQPRIARAALAGLSPWVPPRQGAEAQLAEWFDPARDAVLLLSHLLPLEPDSRAELEINIALIAEAPATPELIPIRDQAARAIYGLCHRLVAALAPGLNEVRVDLEARRLHALVDGLALHILAEPRDGAAADRDWESEPHAAPGRGSWGVQVLREEIDRIAEIG